MKKRILFPLMIIAFMIFSCNNSKPENAKDQSIENTGLQSESQEVENKKPKELLYNITAKFIMFVPSSDGTWYYFDCDRGNEYKFFADESCKEASDLFFPVMPNNSDHKYNNTYFDVEYKQIAREFYSNATGAYETRYVDVITKINKK